MTRSTACLLLISALALAACGTTGSVNDGAGYAALTPSPATRAFIVEQDQPFARQVVAHNQQCRTDPLCRKGK